MRLCEHFHITPAELGEMDFQIACDFVTILRYDAEIRRQASEETP